MTHELQVTYAAPEHCHDLGRIMAESFRSAFRDLVSRETLERCAVAENCAGLIGSIRTEMGVLAGWVDGRPMGLLVFAQRPDGRTEIKAIHSLPESWGTGLGAAMLEFALSESGTGKGVGLWAFEKNARARRFYEKQGFSFTGETRVREFDGAIEVRYERNLV